MPDADMTSPATVDELLALFDEAFIDQLYRSLLGREPDPVGRLGHIDQLRRGFPKEAFIAHFAMSAEGVAHGASIEGLAEICSQVNAPSGGRASGWLAARARAAGLATTADLAVLENRLGRQLQAMRTAPERVVVQADAAVRNLPGPRPMDAAEANTVELYRRMVQLGQAVARLDERLQRFEQQVGRAERQAGANEVRQRAEFETTVHGLRAALDRIEQRLSASPAAALDSEGRVSTPPSAERP